MRSAMALVLSGMAGAKTFMSIVGGVAEHVGDRASLAYFPSATDHVRRRPVAKAV
jgi:hypothetical protein